MPLGYVGVTVGAGADGAAADVDATAELACDETNLGPDAEPTRADDEAWRDTEVEAGPAR